LIVCVSGINFPNAIAQQNPQLESKREILKKIEPLYPEVAQRVGLKGDVRLQVKVSAASSITSIQVLGGSPVFVTTAVEAVKKWRWKRASGTTEEVVLIMFGNP
jgi:TonB family protein